MSEFYLIANQRLCQLISFDSERNLISLQKTILSCSEGNNKHYLFIFFD